MKSFNKEFNRYSVITICIFFSHLGSEMSKIAPVYSQGEMQTSFEDYNDCQSEPEENPIPEKADLKCEITSSRNNINEETVGKTLRNGDHKQLSSFDSVSVTFSLELPKMEHTGRNSNLRQLSRMFSGTGTDMWLVSVSFS